ncbi:MAG: YkgJ family cysteine cluster protein [Oscillospiraceae bacterium]|nr:YkgJ family cysteine cluster protein [Oscillospiraceae bacterium]
MISPSEVNYRAERLDDENYKLRSFLKNRADEKELDRQFLELHNELFENYDCSNCRNCCKEYAAILKETETEAIAAFLQMSKEDFITQYANNGCDRYELKDTPCCFLTDENICQIEDCKPQNCKDYPYTNKPGRLWSLLGVMGSVSVCPVVFEIVERLKRLYGFRSKR